MFPKKLVSQKIGVALVSASCLAVTVAFAIAGNTQQAQPDSISAKATTNPDSFQPTEFEHVEVRSIPRESNSKPPRPSSQGRSNAWIYEEPGTPHQPQAQVRARNAKTIKSEKLPGGGVILHLNRNLMNSSTAHVAKNGGTHLSCDKADGTAHRH